jgi:ABC-type transport system involved in multi-copper enzyme maturation permease subunit
VTRFLRAEVSQRWRSTVAMAFGAFAILVAIGASYQSFGFGSHQGLFGGKTPSAISAFSGSRSADVFSPRHFLALGFNHPLFLIFTMAVAIALPTASIAGDIETGRAELLYSRPLRRERLLLQRAGVWLTAQCVVLFAAWAGANVGGQLSTDMRAAGHGHLTQVPVQSLSLLTFVAGTSFLASSLSRTRGAAVSVAVGVAAGAFLVNTIALLWEPVQWLHHLTPFGYYEPLVAIDRGVQWAPWLVLTGAGLALFGLSVIRLRRRDLV